MSLPAMVSKEQGEYLTLQDQNESDNILEWLTHTREKIEYRDVYSTTGMSSC